MSRFGVNTPRILGPGGQDLGQLNKNNRLLANEIYYSRFTDNRGEPLLYHGVLWWDGLAINRPDSKMMINAYRRLILTSCLAACWWRCVIIWRDGIVINSSVSEMVINA